MVILFCMLPFQVSTQNRMFLPPCPPTSCNLVAKKGTEVPVNPPGPLIFRLAAGCFCLATCSINQAMESCSTSKRLSQWLGWTSRWWKLRKGERMLRNGCIALPFHCPSSLLKAQPLVKKWWATERDEISRNTRKTGNIKS